MSTTLARPRRRGRGYPLPALTNRTWAAVALLGAIGLAGTSTVATKAALGDVPPLTLGFRRFGLALLALLVACRRSGVRPVFGRMPALLGITGIAIPFSCQNLGLQSTGAATATLIIEGAIPMATAFFGVWLLRERLTGRRVAGLILAVAGVVVIVLRGAGGDVSFGGTLLLLGTAVSFALYNVVGRRAFAGGLSLGVLAGSFAIGSLLLAPGAAVEMTLRGPGSFDVEGGVLVLYLGLAGSALTQALWARGLVHLEAFEVAILGTLLPVAGIAAAALFLGETIVAVQAVGLPFILAGLLLSARPEPKATPTDRHQTRLPIRGIGNPRESRRTSRPVPTSNMA